MIGKTWNLESEAHQRRVFDIAGIVPSSNLLIFPRFPVSPIPRFGEGFSGVSPMEQRLSIITLGVSDLKRSHTFYDALGWKVASEEQADQIVAYDMKAN